MTFRIMKLPVYLILLTLYVTTTQTKKEENKLLGAVVSYQPVWHLGKSDNWNLFANVEAYCAFILEASKSAAEIVVFPAEGLGGIEGKKIHVTVPDVTEKFNPSNEDKPDNIILPILSHCAKAGHIYVVFTVDELVNNQPCITQLALDREGTIIARNRGLRCRNTNSTNYDEEIFTMDNGHKVGLMLNDDLFLQERTDILKQLGLDYFVLSYDLPESLPFATGVQTEWWWSFKENRLLLAAGLADGKRGGSGVFIGRKLGFPKLKDGYKPGDILIIQKLPNITDKPFQYAYMWDEPKMDLYDRNYELIRQRRDSSTTAFAEAYVYVDKRDLTFTKDENLHNYKRLQVNANFIKITNEKQRFLMDETLCDGDLCCRFKMKWNVRMVPPYGFNGSTDGTDPLETLQNLTASFEQDEESKRLGCYLIVIGNHEENLGEQGVGHVKRCAVVYSESKRYCRQTSITRSLFSPGKPLDYQKPLHRHNAALHRLKIDANQPNLTPNMLIQNHIELVPHSKAFVFNDLPVSRLYVKKTFHRFLTLGIQGISNYTLIN